MRRVKGQVEIPLIHESHHLFNVGKQIRVDLELWQTGHVLNRNADFVLPDLGLKILYFSQPEPEFILEKHPVRRMKIDQWYACLNRQVGTALELIDLVPPAINFEERSMDREDREDALQFLHMPQISGAGKVMVDNDLHTIKTDIPGHFEDLLGG